jgi:tetratricopeptide (TPR) repeat protein
MRLIVPALLGCAAVLAHEAAGAAATVRPVAPDAYAAYCMGVRAVSRSEYPQAITWFKTALAADPRSADTHIWLGLLYGEHAKPARPERAREHLEKALKLAPDSFRARYGLAKELVREGKLDKARDEMLIAVRLPKARENPALLGKAYSELAVRAELSGEWESALRHYRQAVKVSPNPAYALLRLGRLCRAMGKHDQAVDAFLKLAHQVPTYARVQRELCEAYKALGRWDKALVALRKYMTHRNGPGEQSHLLKEAADLAVRARKSELASALHEKLLLRLLERYTADKAAPHLCEDIASTLQHLGRHEKAEPYLEKAVDAAKPATRPLLRKKLARLYEKLGKYDEAAGQLRAAIKTVEPRASIPYRAQLCGVLEAAGKFEQAEQALAAILDIPGARAAGHAELGLFHKRRGQIDKADEHLREAIKSADTRHRVRYTIQLSMVYSDADQGETAEQLLSQALKEFPEDPSLNNALGWYYAERGIQLRRARSLIQKALEARPENPYYIDSLGWVYFRQGETEKALEQLLKASRLAEDSVICDHLGDVYMKLGQPDKASEQWRRSLELDPGSEGVRRKLERLKQDR